MTDVTELSGTYRHHPIVSWLCCRNKDCIAPCYLKQFIAHCANIQTSDKAIPDTLTDFMREYVTFRIGQYESGCTEHAVKDMRFSSTISAITNEFALLAFKQRVLGKTLFLAPITRRMEELNESRGFPVPRDLVTSLIFGFLKSGASDVCLYGKRCAQYSQGCEIPFNERLVQDYFVAVHQKNLCLKNKNKKMKKRLPKIVCRSVRMLKVTSDSWRMTFGLLAKEPIDSTTSPPALKKLFSAFLAKASSSSGISQMELTRLGVEIVYEAQNVEGLADLLPDFSLNNSLIYRTRASCDRAEEQPLPQVLPQQLDLYAVTAVGFLIGSSADLYSVEMPRCGLNVSSIRLLSSPVHKVSDNYIQMLNLSGNEIGDDGMRTLQRFLVKASRLTYLDLSACGLNESGARILANVLVCFPLQYLNLALNNIGHCGVCELVSNLKYLPTLEWLSFADNNLLDYSLISLSESLPHLPSLCGLDFSGNHVTDRGVESLSRFLPPSLSHLSLRRNLITESGAKIIASALARSRAVRHVDLSENCIDNEGVDALLKAAAMTSAAQSVKATMSPTESLTPTAMLAATAMLLMSSVHRFPTLPSVLEGGQGRGGDLVNVCVVVKPQKQPQQSFAQQFKRRPSRRSLSGEAAQIRAKNFAGDSTNISAMKKIGLGEDGGANSSGFHDDEMTSDGEVGRKIEPGLDVTPTGGAQYVHNLSAGQYVPNLSLVSTTCTVASSGRRYTMSDMSGGDLSSSEWDESSDLAECSSSRTAAEVFNNNLSGGKTVEVLSSGRQSGGSSVEVSPVRLILPRTSSYKNGEAHEPFSQRRSSPLKFETVCEEDCELIHHPHHHQCVMSPVETCCEEVGCVSEVGEECGEGLRGLQVAPPAGAVGVKRIKSLTGVNTFNKCWHDLTSIYN